MFERAGVERVIVNAAGCGSTLKDYGALLADDSEWAARAKEFSSRVRDVLEFVEELGEPRAPRREVRMRAVYQDACHLLHAQGIGLAPRSTLAAIPGVELVEIDEAGMCCGSGGVYNILQPEAGEELGLRKARMIDQAKPQVVLSANPGCRIQLETAARTIGASWKVIHPIEVIDASIRGGRVRQARPAVTRSGSRPSPR